MCRSASDITNVDDPEIYMIIGEVGAQWVLVRE